MTVKIICRICLAPVAYVRGDYPIEAHTCPKCNSKKSKRVRPTKRKP